MSLLFGSSTGFDLGHNWLTAVPMVSRLAAWGSVVVFGVFGVVLSAIVVNELVRFSTRIPNLPGPRGYPLVGSLPNLHRKVPADEYRQWVKQYGEVFQLQLGNTITAVVNSAAAARGFLISQREATNGRPRFYVLHKRFKRKCSH